MIHTEMKLFWALIVILWSGNCISASFDCNKAQSATEKTICATPGVSSLDELLEKDYQNAKDIVEDKAALIAEQRAWLKERDRCGDNSGCILG